jgi:hypothetical protein
MKLKAKPTTKATASLPLAFATTRGFRVHIRKHRDAVHQRFPSQNDGQRKLINLVLNEAEALACQTPFPHLVFPTLAEEMAETLAKWRARQQALRRQEAEHSLAS